MNIHKNIDTHQFELLVEGHLAFISYEYKDDTYLLTHSEVPTELRGKGIGGQLVTLTYEYINNEGKKVVPLCGFVKTMAEKKGL